MSCLLFVPATEPQKFAKAQELGCSAIVLDLEDAVDPRQKGAARQQAVKLLGQRRTKPVFVRINATSTPWWREDLAAIVSGHPEGVVVPKAEEPLAIQAIDEYLTALETQMAQPIGHIRLELILETARGVTHMERVLEASPRVARATLGMADLCRDLGVDWSRAVQQEPPLFLAERTQLALISRSVGLAAPYDSVFMDFRDDEGLVRDATLGRRLGYAGKHVIHPRQIDAVNAIYAVTAQERERAQRILQAYEGAQRAGKGATEVDGLLVDEPVVAWARDVLFRTEATR